MRICAPLPSPQLNPRKRALPEIAGPDRFESSPADLNLTRPSWGLQSREQRYRRLAERLQTALEGSERQAPPNWVALAVKPTHQVGEMLHLLEGGLGSLWPALAGPALGDPQVLVVSSLRAGRLLISRPWERALQLKEFLQEGSAAIENRLTPTLLRYLDWQEMQPEGREHVASLLKYLGQPREDGCVQAALLYHQAACRPSQRRELIELANQILLAVEQKTVLQPIYAKYPQLEPVFELLTPQSAPAAFETKATPPPLLRRGGRFQRLG